MTTDDRIAAARRQLAEVEATLCQALASARGCLSTVEEENRELRRESIERRTEFYTEMQFAKLLQVSVSTLKRLRTTRGLDHLLVGQQIRYSSAHIESAQQKLAAGRGQKSEVRSRPRRIA